MLALVGPWLASQPPDADAGTTTRRSLTLSPQLCVCVLSHKRLDLLNTTLTAIVQHLEHVEAGLPYELVWVDNGSDEVERHALHRRFSFEKVLFLGTNYGMAYGFNSLFFRLCSAPYFLTLEEDWEWLPSRGLLPAAAAVGQTALRDAIAVLRHDPGLSGVFLRPDTLDQFLSRGPWKRAPRRAAASAASPTVVAVDGAGGATALSQAAGSGAAASSVGGGGSDHDEHGGDGNSGSKHPLANDGGGSSDGGVGRGWGGGEGEASHVEYATYCMDRGASYLWGAYSNGPGVYDRARLMRRVGRQFGEPGDRFPDPASESNYAYRVGAAGLCSAVLRVWEGCEGVHQCNTPLFAHLGDERSHGYGKGRRPDVRWLLYGGGSPMDEALVRLRQLDVEPTPHWLGLHLSRGRGVDSSGADGDRDGGGEGGGGEGGEGGGEGGQRIALLVGARGTTLDQVEAMARSALATANAPSQLEVLWQPPRALQAACAELNRRLGEDLMVRLRLPRAHAHPSSYGVLKCVGTGVGGPAREPASLAERFALLAGATRADLLLLCPRVVRFGQAPPAGAPSGTDSSGTDSERPGAGSGGAASPAASDDSPTAPPMAWDREARAAFGGSGDVRRFPKDRVLMLQARPRDQGTPSAHALVHRASMEHLGYFSPAPVGEDWRLFSLWTQAVFGGVGRHRWLGSAGSAASAASEPKHPRGIDADSARLWIVEEDGAQAASAKASKVAKNSEAGGNGEAGGSRDGAASAPLASLRSRFERSAGSRAIDTHRMHTLLLELQPKSRTAFEHASSAYRTFSTLYNAGRLSEAWPKLAEVLWALETVERSDDWEVRDVVGPSMLPAAQDVLAKMLDRLGGDAARTLV